MKDFVTLPLWLIGSVFVSLGVVVSLISFLIIRKAFPNGIITGDSIRPASLVGTVIGSLFALLLALILVTVWQNYTIQKERVTSEAVILANLYRDSRGLAPVKCGEIQNLARAYTGSIVKFGWVGLEKGIESKESFYSFNQLYRCVITYQPQNRSEEVIYKRLIEHLNELANYRRLRLMSIDQNNVPGTLWVIIIVVGFISVCFTNLFVIGNNKAQATIVSIHGAIISLILMLVFMLNQPYRGSTKIKPYPFEHLIRNVYPVADSI